MIEYLFHNSFILQLHWSGNKVSQTVLKPVSGNEKQAAGTSKEPSFLLKALARGYLDREPSLWLNAPLDWSSLSSFQAGILKTLLWSVPWGRTITYSRLAALAGHPRAARAAGTAMANNPWPLLIPCHRVVGANQRCGGFTGGMELKKILLNLEQE